MCACAFQWRAATKVGWLNSKHINTLRKKHNVIKYHKHTWRASNALLRTPKPEYRTSPGLRNCAWSLASPGHAILWTCLKCVETLLKATKGLGYQGLLGKGTCLDCARGFVAMGSSWHRTHIMYMIAGTNVWDCIDNMWTIPCGQCLNAFASATRVDIHDVFTRSTEAVTGLTVKWLSELTFWRSYRCSQANGISLFRRLQWVALRLNDHVHPCASYILMRADRAVPLGPGSRQERNGMGQYKNMPKCMRDCSK